MNIIEFWPLDWNQNQALPTMQSQTSLDWSLLDSQLMKTRGTSWMEESMNEKYSHSISYILYPILILGEIFHKSRP